MLYNNNVLESSFSQLIYLRTVPLSASLMKFPSSRSNAKPLQLKQKCLITNLFIYLPNPRNNLYFQKVTMCKRAPPTQVNGKLIKQLRPSKNSKIKYHP